MTDTPAVVPDALFEALGAHLDPAQLVELTAAIAWENFLARFSRGVALEPAGFSEGAFCPFPDPAGGPRANGASCFATIDGSRRAGRDPPRRRTILRSLCTRADVEAPRLAQIWMR